MASWPQNISGNEPRARKEKMINEYSKLSRKIAIGKGARIILANGLTVIAKILVFKNSFQFVFF